MTKFFFSDIVHWNPMKCLQMKKKIMPKIIVSFLNADFSSKIAILHIITEKLLPYLTSLEREKIFVPVLLEVCNLYEIFCEKAITAIVENIDEINKIKAHVIKEMNSAIVVICKLSECLLTDACKNTDRPSFLILDYGFRILTYTYKFLEEAHHCSGNDLADSLVRMHASSKVLMKSVIEMLTKYLLSGNCVIPLRLLMICANIQRLYEVVAVQKPEIHVLLWRVYAKVIIHHSVLREGSISFHGDQISYLCLYTRKLFEDLRICGGKNAGKDCVMKNFDRQVQICGYHLKVITYLIGERAEFEDECYENLRNLVEELASFSLFYFSKNFCGRSCNNWFHCNIVSSIECLLHYLLQKESFLSFLILPLKKGEIKQEEKASLCFCKLFGMQLVIANAGDVQKCSCSTVLAVAENVIEDLCLCGAKFLYTFITVIKSKDGTFRIINLYEYMLIALCAFPSKCCPEHFKDMEKLMLKTLLGKNDEFSCLACDVWFFFFGCGAVNLIHCYFDMFKKTAKYHNERSFMWMNYLMNRIAKFISHEVKASFLRTYHSFHTLIQAKCVHFRNTESHRVYLLQDIMVEQSPVLFYQRRLKKLDALLFHYDDTDLAKVILIDISTCLLLLSRHLVNNADPKSLLQLIYFAGVMWSTQCDVIQIAVLLFLQALKGKYVSPNPEQNRIFRCLGKLFANVLGHKNYVMKNEAYNVFYEFLQSTPQRRIIEECFEISPHLLIPVQKFIKKVPSIKLISNQEIIEPLVCELLRGETDVKLHMNDKLHLHHILNASKSEILDKKQRQEMHLLLKGIRNSFEQLASFGKLPSWVSRSLKDSWQLVNKFNY